MELESDASDASDAAPPSRVVSFFFLARAVQRERRGESECEEPDGVNQVNERAVW